MEAINTSNEGSRLQALQEKIIDLENGQMIKNLEESQKEKNKRKHNSALVAAAAGRSAVQHAHLHIITNKPGDFAHTGTNISYEN